MSIQSIGSAGGSASLQQLREKLFARADADRSGGISLDEFQKLGRGQSAGGAAGTAGTKASDAAQKIFKALDSDQDGNLTSAELDAAKPPQGGFSTDSLATLLDAQERQDGGTGGNSNAASTSQADALLVKLLAAYSKANKDTGEAQTGRASQLGEV